MPVLSPSALALLAEARRAVLITVAPDGHPRPVPVCYAVVDDEVWSPLDAKPKRTQDPRHLARVRDIEARPAVALLVDRWTEDWARLAWLRIEGVADVVAAGGAGSARAAEALRGRYPQYRDQQLELRPMLRLRPRRVVAWDGGSREPGA